VTCFFLIPDYQAVALFQVTDASLDRISVAVPLVVTDRRASGSFSEVFSGWDRRLDPSVREPAPDPGGVVGPIASNRGALTGR
jgi:hypothetical protein